MSSPADSTPVIVGIGQVTHHPGDLVTPVELMERAIALAGDDSGAKVLAEAGGLFLSPPWVQGSEAAALTLGAEFGIPASRCRTGQFSGSMPQELLGEACRAVAEGGLQVAIVTGGVADASVKAALRRSVPPPGAQSFGAALGSQAEAKSSPPRTSMPPTPEGAAKVDSALAMFAMVESALWAEAGGTAAERRDWLGQIMAPFTTVAQRHDGAAWFAQARQPADIATVTPENRMVAEPYTKLMTSFPTVDMAGALVVTSTATADRLGVPADRRVYPWAIAACNEAAPPSGRLSIAKPAALTAAVQQAMTSAGVGTEDIGRFDLYSCFPSSVQMCANALGLDLLDPRGLTVTGGLPYFGGPGAAYVVMAIAAMVAECRSHHGSIGAVVGVGGFASHFSAGIYSAAPPPGGWSVSECPQQAATEAQAVPVDLGATGEAIVEAGTVIYDHDGPAAAPVIAVMPDGRRTGARLRDRAAAAALAGRNLAGQRVLVTLGADAQPYYEPL